LGYSVLGCYIGFVFRRRRINRSFQHNTGGAAADAVDGDRSTFSTTSNSTDHEWWEIRFGSGRDIGEIRIINRWCGDVTDPDRCRCRLSNAKVWLFGESGQFLAGDQLGKTCDMDEIMVKFDPAEKFCKTAEELATDVAESPEDKLEAGICQDDLGFVTAEGHTCAFIAEMTVSSQNLLCNRAGNMDYLDDNGLPYLTSHFCSVTCGDCVPDVKSGADVQGVGASPTTMLTDQPHLSHKPTPLGGNTEPTYSPTYLPSAQPIVTPKDPTYSPTYLPSAQPIATPTTKPTDKPTPLGGNTEPTYSPTYLPSALANEDEPLKYDPNLNSNLDGHAYSEGDVCEDDPTFVSDKGITCKSFVYAETVHCRTTTGMHDSDFNALRYSDFCPETCGLCAEVAASMVTADEVNSTAIGVGVGLSVGFVIAMFFTWLWCNADKMKKVTSRHVSEFRDDPSLSEFRDDPTMSETRSEYRDDGGVGLRKPGQEEKSEDEVDIALPNMEGLFPDVGKDEEVVPKTEIV